MSGSKPGSLALMSRVCPEARPAIACAVWMIGRGHDTSRLSSTSSATVVVRLAAAVALFIGLSRRRRKAIPYYLIGN
jgi:hypothetical protein